MAVRSLLSRGIVALALTATAVGGVWYARARVSRPAPIAPEAAREMERGERFAAALLASADTTPAEQISRGNAVAAGYLERLHLGLGSPFRMIDMVLRDPWLPDTARTPLAYALLSRALGGDAYRVDPLAMAPVSDTPMSLDVAGRHLALIDSVIAAAKTPREGELTVRLAYRFAAASRSISRRGPWLATMAAAMARDRALASNDARALLVEARRLHTDPLALLRDWRALRRFAVEQPIMTPLAADHETRALEDVEPVLAAINVLGARADSSAIASTDTAATSAAPWRPRIYLGEKLARRLAWVAAERGAPPEAPVSVAVSSIVREDNALRSRAFGLARFARQARNEETLAGEYALFAARDTTGAPDALVAALWSAVSLRTYGQEAVWFPGDSGPTVRQLKARFELGSISFDEETPATWRPYYLRMLALAITDLERVLPEFSVRGLGVHFGESPMHGAALAMHDPSSRTIFFPLATGAGVMTHELAHDLDWQAARLRYAARGTYSTDRAMRDRSDRLATSVLQLAAAGHVDPLPTPASEIRVQPSSRPTEVFARNVDWFVSAALAREGRMNGYLSSVQDEVLTGYGAVVSPESARDAGDAMVEALEEMTVVPPETRGWFLSRFGTQRALPPYELARRVLEVPLAPSDLRRVRSVAFDAPLVPDVADGEQAAASMLAVGGDRCGVSGAQVSGDLADVRRKLAVLAADARARGMLRRRADYASKLAENAPWTLRALLGEPWRPAIADSMRADLRDLIMRRALAAERSRGVWAIVHATPRDISACD